MYAIIHRCKSLVKCLSLFCGRFYEEADGAPAKGEKTRRVERDRPQRRESAVRRQGVGMGRGFSRTARRSGDQRWTVLWFLFRKRCFLFLEYIVFFVRGSAFPLPPVCPRMDGVAWQSPKRENEPPPCSDARLVYNGKATARIGAAFWGPWRRWALRPRLDRSRNRLDRLFNPWLIEKTLFQPQYG